jgi:hypothetical protein
MCNGHFKSILHTWQQNKHTFKRLIAHTVESVVFQCRSFNIQISHIQYPLIPGKHKVLNLNLTS